MADDNDGGLPLDNHFSDDPEIDQEADSDLDLLENNHEDSDQDELSLEEDEQGSEDEAYDEDALLVAAIEEDMEEDWETEASDSAQDDSSDDDAGDDLAELPDQAIPSGGAWIAINQLNQVPVQTHHASLFDLSAELHCNIMSLMNSPTDLRAFAASSRIMRDRFKASQRIILVDLAEHNYGDAIADATIWASVERLPRDRDNRYEIWTAVLKWRGAKTQEFDWKAALMADPELVYRVLDMLEPLRYFVKMYTYSRLAEYGDCTLGRGCAGPTSTTEQARIMMAILRYETVVKLCAGKGRPSPMEEPLLSGYLFSIWNSWELEQISLVNSFMHLVITSVAYNEPINVGQDKLAWLDEDDLADDFERHERENYLLSLRAENGRIYARRYGADVMALREKIAAVSLKDNSFPVKFRKGFSRMRLFGSGVEFEYMHSSMTRFDPRRTIWQPAHQPVLPPFAVHHSAIEYKGDTPFEAPWAWVHALNGQEEEGCWGDGLITDKAQQVPQRKASAFDNWREVGLVFWDKSRAEKIIRQQPKGGASWCKAKYDAGWLLTPWTLAVESPDERSARRAAERAAGNA